MARLTLVASALLVILVVAEASIYFTTVTTAEVSQGGGIPVECLPEMRRVDMLHCERFIHHAAMYPDLMMVNKREQDLRWQCCNQLSQKSMQCRCPAAFRAATEAMGDSHEQEPYLERAYRTARKLPKMCDLEPWHCQE